MISNLLAWMADTGRNLIIVYSSIFETFSNGFTVPGFDTEVSINSLIFTLAGVAVFISYTIIKWLIP